MSAEPEGEAFRGALSRRVDRWLEHWWRVSPRGRPELRTTLTVLIGSAIALLGSFVTRVVMARVLSPAELGLLLLAIAIASPLAGVLSLGLSQATALVVAARRAAGDEAGARRAASSAVCLAAMAGGIGAGALVLFAFPLARLFTSGEEAGSLRALLWAVSPIVFSLPVGLAMLGVHRGFGGATARAVLRDGGGGVSRTLGVGIAALTGAGATALGLGFALGTAASDAIYVGYGAARGWIGRLRGRLDRELLERVRGFAPLQVVTELRRWSDVLVVGLLLDSEQVGLYGLARGFGRVLEAIQQAPAHSFLPTATTLDDERLRPVHGRARDLTIALLWVPAVLCLVAPDLLIVPVAGGAYRAASPVLAWLALVVLVDVAWGFNQPVLLSRGAERGVLAVTGATIAATVVLATVLAPRWGGAGAAAGLAAAEAVRVALLTLLLRRRGYRPPTIGPAVLLALAALGAASLWRWTVAPEPRVQVAIAAVVAVLGVSVLGFSVLRAQRQPPDTESTSPGDRRPSRQGR